MDTHRQTPSVFDLVEQSDIMVAGIERQGVLKNGYDYLPSILQERTVYCSNILM